jgi:hypothetical protein
MNEYEKTIEVLQDRVSALEQLIQPVVGVRKWQPKGGDFFIQSSGKVSEVVNGSDTPHREFGVERPARQQAERACIEMRRFNRLLALRDELCGDEVLDWENGEEKYYLYHWNGDAPKWRIGIDIYSRMQTPYFTSYDLAQRACDMLNSEEVEL